MSDTGEFDTETLLAIIASLLQHPLPEQHVLLEALVRSNGDVQKAAKSLQQRYSSSTGGDASSSTKKRPATGVLDSWLNPFVIESSHSRKRGKVASPSTCEAPRPTSPKSSTTLQVSTSHKSRSKPLVPLAEILRPPPPISPAVPRLAPLTLSNPAMVEKHTPCTLHLKVLPSELASRLFHCMVDAAQGWKRNKWWLFERLVESPHKTCFFARRVDGIDDDESWQEAAQFWYNGRVSEPPPVFPSEMEEACQIIEKVVNESLIERARYPLEWGGSASEGYAWKANVAASNCYEGGGEGVGFHSDQLTYLGPYPTIASLSLGTTRNFRLREVIPKGEIDKRQAQTYNIPVVHNSLVIMHASTQERFKHSIPVQNAIDLFHPPSPSHLKSEESAEPSNCRINITFRFYRPDFRPQSIPRCRCDVPCILRADMKGRDETKAMQYLWMCYSGAQTQDKGCSFYRMMDCKSEARGPFIGD